MVSNETLKNLSIKDNDYKTFINQLDDIYEFCFREIRDKGLVFIFNNFLIDSEEEYLDITKSNDYYLKKNKYILFAVGPNGESFTFEKSTGNVVVLYENDDGMESEHFLAKGFKGFLIKLKRAKKI